MAESHSWVKEELQGEEGENEWWDFKEEAEEASDMVEVAVEVEEPSVGVAECRFMDEAGHGKRTASWDDGSGKRSRSESWSGDRSWERLLEWN